MDNYTALANTFKIIHQWDSCIYYSNKVLETSKAAKYPIAQMKAIELLAGSYKAKNNIDSTAKYFEMALAAKDSLFNQEKLTQLQNLAFNEQLRQQEIQEQQQKRLYRYRLYVSFGGLLVLAIIAFILYRSNVQKQNARIKIEKAYTELKSTQAQLIQSEKMASLGELTAGIAHEIQNPLNFVNNFSETNVELLTELREEISKGNFEEANALATDVIENEQKIAHHGRRAEAIVRNMLEHSRSSKGEKQDTDVNALADEYLRLAYHGFRAKDKSFNAALETNFDASLGKVNIVPQEIGRVLLNLFNNAFYAVGEKKKHTGDSYEPAVAVSTKKLNDKVEIMVKDNGTGIPQRAIDKILQPFFTTKPTGQGTGLGLSLSYDIVKAHGGELKVESTEGEGTIFTVLLPLS
jgi:signal transduction histidine kinase